MNASSWAKYKRNYHQSLDGFQNYRRAKRAGSRLSLGNWEQVLVSKITQLFYGEES
jgi:hypothetical protein